MIHGKCTSTLVDDMVVARAAVFDLAAKKHYPQPVVLTPGRDRRVPAQDDGMATSQNGSRE